MIYVFSAYTGNEYGFTIHKEDSQGEDAIMTKSLSPIYLDLLGDHCTTKAIGRNKKRNKDCLRMVWRKIQSPGMVAATPSLLSSLL